MIQSDWKHVLLCTLAVLVVYIALFAALLMHVRRQIPLPHTLLTPHHRTTAPAG